MGRLMQGQPTGFWGKLRQDDEGRVLAWHPLEAHAADVAACCEALLQKTLIGRRLAEAAGCEALPREHVARLSAIAALHDIGKYSIGFQNKALLRPNLTCGHVGTVLALFGDRPSAERDRFCDAVPIDDLTTWGPTPETALRLLVAAICHHGRPEKIEAQPHQRSWWQPARGLDPFDGMSRLGTAARRWFPEAFTTPRTPLPDRSAFQHVFSGLVMLADWIGSDTKFFPYADAPADRMPFAREAAADALRATGLDVSEARSSLGSAAPSFRSVFGFQPRDGQRRVAELPADGDGSLTILESDTGSGKTEAALARFFTLFAAGLVDGMYFALPTRTAATQIFRRTVRAIAEAFPDPVHRPPVVLAVPGYLAVDDIEGQRLPGFEVLWNDDSAERMRFRGWAAEHPKRYLAGTIVVGTIDQTLLSTLTVSHAHLRAAALSRHLLIVDEVHASDAYMTRLLEEVLGHHLGLGGHAFLMSATLGSAARHGVERRQISAPPQSLEAAIAEPYPVLRHHAREGSVHVVPLESPAPREVRIELHPTLSDPAAIAGAALTAAIAGARVVVLRNTVRGCVDVQLALEREASSLGVEKLLFRCADVVAPHHARYAKEDRQALDEAVEQSFGKHRRNSESGCVVVATQTIQQSLDLDADLLLTDLCPMDVLLQRIGRLHRHARASRPRGYESAVCRVLVEDERDLGRLIRRDGEARGSHGFGTVYEDLRILEATWRLLEAEPVLRIPSMCRRLVEQTTHPTALDEVSRPLGGGWPRHEQYLLGRYYAHSHMARLNLVDREQPFGEYGFPSREVAGRAATRLGEGDRVAELPPGAIGPFGTGVRRLTIPAWLARDAPASADATDVVVASGEIRFRFGSEAYAYDRLGLRLLKPDDSREEDIADA